MKPHHLILLLINLIILSLGTTLHGQISGESVYDINVLHEVRLQFDQDNYWQQMEQNFESSTEFESVPYIMTTVTIDGEVVDSVGARFKGFTSYTFYSNKKPIKLDFNEYVGGQRLDGLRKLNLNNATGDPGMHRDVIAYEMMRKMGVSAPRTAFAKLYINDEYWGLYQLIEQVDKEFLEDNYAYSKGNLFKNKGWNKFEYFGSSESNYSPPYQIKTNKDENDWEGFINLMDVLNNTTDEEFITEIQQVFNVHQYLKVLAVDVATNNWDSYLEHGRNWYVYEDTESNLFNWIPWDYNFSLGGGFTDIGGGGCDIWPDFVGVKDGTTTVSFKDKSWIQGEEPTYFWDFGDNKTSDIKDPIHEYENHGVYNVCLTVKAEECEETYCTSINTNNNPADCPVIGTTGPDEANEYFQHLLSFNSNCCAVWGEECEDFYQILQNNGDFSSDFSVDQQNNEGVLIKRLLAVENFRELYYSYFCELMEEVMVEEKLFETIDFNFNLIDEGVESDPNFLFAYTDFRKDIGADGNTGLKEILIERIAQVQEDLDELYNCSESDLNISSGDIVINELVASNELGGGEKDDQGEYNDWIEIYNNTDRYLDLSRMYLSDDNSSLLKWKFPVGSIIAPGQYRIVWMDEDVTDVGYHASFKLPKIGGEIYLSNLDGTIIDEVIYGEQTTNIAFARIPNGTGDFAMKATTFGYNNESLTSVEEENNIQVTIQPNPTSQFIEVNLIGINNSEIKASLFNSTGQELFSSIHQENNFNLDLGEIPAGVYILKLEGENGFSENKMVIRIN